MEGQDIKKGWVWKDRTGRKDGYERTVHKEKMGRKDRT